MDLLHAGFQRAESGGEQQTYDQHRYRDGEQNRRNDPGGTPGHLKRRLYGREEKPEKPKTGTDIFLCLFYCITAWRQS